MVPPFVRSFRDSRLPRVSVELIGPTATTSASAIIDTGFSGFLQIPMQTAVDIGLHPTHFTQVTDANGASHIRKTCRGSVRFDGGVKQGSFMLGEAAATPVLLGIEWLFILRRTLTIDPVDQRWSLSEPQPLLPPLPWKKASG